VRKWFLVGFACVSLACSGLTETALEMSGTSMEIGEDGSVTMTLPDGQTLKTQQGGEVPDGFPLPEPWEGAEIESVTEMSRDGELTMVTVNYKGLKRPKDEVIASYEAWFEEHGELMASEDVSAPGLTSLNIVGRLPDGRHGVVNINELMGQNSVSLVVQNTDDPSALIGKVKGEADVPRSEEPEGTEADGGPETEDDEG